MKDVKGRCSAQMQVSGQICSTEQVRLVPSSDVIEMVLAILKLNGLQHPIDFSVSNSMICYM